MSVIDEEDSRPAADWIVTYGDMMSLLLTFFILLVSMGEIQKKKYEAMVDSLRRSFGSGAGMTSVQRGGHRLKGAGSSDPTNAGPAKPGGSARGGADTDGPRGPRQRTVIIRPGQNPTKGAVIYFEETSSQLTPHHEDVLKRTAVSLQGKPQKIEIRGHTSAFPLPPNGPYATRWDLAFARCMHTMEYLVKLNIDSKRMRISIAAENEPLHRGSDPFLHQENSRVEVFMLDEFVADFEDQW